MLIDHINKKVDLKKSTSTKFATKSDQAETIDKIFDCIYNKINIFKQQFWDPCIFQPYWHHKSHYNALTHLWQGDFKFCNPPYSLGAKFVSKCLLEFLRVKYIVMLIPLVFSYFYFFFRYI
jgi:hypothetical protein